MSGLNSNLGAVALMDRSDGNSIRVGHVLARKRIVAETVDPICGHRSCYQLARQRMSVSPLRLTRENQS